MWTIRFQLLALIVAFAGGAAASPSAEPYREECPAGSYLTGFDGRAGDWIDQMHIICARWDASHGRLMTSVTKEAAVGRSNGGDPIRTNCRGRFVDNVSRVNFAHWSYEYPKLYPYRTVLHSMEFACRTLDDPLRPEDARFGSMQAIRRPGGYESVVPIESSCRFGQVATGIEGEHGEFIFSFRLICGEPPKASPVAGAKVNDAAKAKSYNSKWAVSGTSRVGNDIIAAGGATEPLPPPPAQKTATAIADVNIHEKATGASRVLGIMRKDKTFPVVASDPEGDWYLLQFDGAGGVLNGQGWVSQTWLTINQ